MVPSFLNPKEIHDVLQRFSSLAIDGKKDNHICGGAEDDNLRCENSIRSVTGSPRTSIKSMKNTNEENAGRDDDDKLSKEGSATKPTPDIISAVVSAGTSSKYLTDRILASDVVLQTLAKRVASTIGVHINALEPAVITRYILIDIYIYIY